MLQTPTLPDPERRLVRAAFFTLFGILAAQSLLETARDTLFLTRLPVGRLPWLYLAMAAVTLLVGRLSARLGRASTPGALVIGAVVTAALWPALRSTAGIYVLFLWTGIFSAWTVTQVWIVLSESLDLSQAKHLYGRLAAGGGLGAVAGALLARLASGVLDARLLVVLAALVIAATALGPALGLRTTVALAPAAPEAPQDETPPMLARLFAMTALVALVSTLIDFSFKEVVAARLTPAQLPAFFATFHLVGTAISLAVQLFGVGLVLRLVGVGRAQLVLPLTLMAGAIAAVATGGFAAFVLLRGLDTGLRNSFQRPSFELLQVPLRDGQRRRAKPLIDVLGQRGGQALAGLALLVMLQLSVSPQARLWMVAVLLVAWIVVAAGLNTAYVDLLRTALLGTPVTAPDVKLSAINILTSQQSRELGTVMALLARKSVVATGDEAIEALIPLLGREEMRVVARASLMAAGSAALPALRRALVDPAQPRGVRVNAIRPLVELDPAGAAGILAEALLREVDPFVALRVARTLDRLQREQPELSIDREILEQAAVAAGASARRYLAWRLALEEETERNPGRDTATSAMLRVALHEQEETAIELLFQVLALRDPEEDFRLLLAALRDGPRRTRAAARELVANLLTGAARATTLALMEPSDRARLTALGRPAERTGYRTMLDAMGAEGGSIGRLAARHAGELGREDGPQRGTREAFVAA